METPISRLIPEVICGEKAYMCFCSLRTGHGPIHICECGGSWEGSISVPESFIVHAWPRINRGSEEQVTNTCVICGGFGYLGDGEDEDELDECPNCGGSGTVSSPDEIAEEQ